MSDIFFNSLLLLNHLTSNFFLFSLLTLSLKIELFLFLFEYSYLLLQGLHGSSKSIAFFLPYPLIVGVIRCSSLSCVGRGGVGCLGLGLDQGVVGEGVRVDLLLGSAD